MTKLLFVVVLFAVFLVSSLVPLNNDRFLILIFLRSLRLTHAHKVDEGVARGRDVLLRFAHLGEYDVLGARNERILLALGQAGHNVH